MHKMEDFNAVIEFLMKKCEEKEQKDTPILKMKEIIDAEAKELRFIKDIIDKEITQISQMDSILKVKPALEKLKEDVRKKTDYELEKLMF